MVCSRDLSNNILKNISSKYFIPKSNDHLREISLPNSSLMELYLYFYFLSEVILLAICLFLFNEPLGTFIILLTLFGGYLYQKITKKGRTMGLLGNTMNKRIKIIQKCKGIIEIKY